MKENRYDRVVSNITERMGRVNQKISTEFKGRNPFDKEPKSPEDMVAEYLNMTPENKQFIAQSFPEQWGKHEQKIQGILRRKM